MTYYDLCDGADEITVAGEGRVLVVDANPIFGIHYLKLRGGTAAVPVVHAAARTIPLATVAR